MKPLQLLGLLVLVVVTSITSVVVWSYLTEKRQEGPVNAPPAVGPAPVVVAQSEPRTEKSPAAAPKLEQPAVKEEPAPNQESAPAKTDAKPAEPPPSSNAKESNPVRDLTGTLTVKLTRNLRAPADCRIYVDGRIVARKPGPEWIAPGITKEGEETIVMLNSFAATARFAIDGTLRSPVDPRSEDVTLQLLPGQYKVEVASRREYAHAKGDPTALSWDETPRSPFILQSKVVKVEAGKTTAEEFNADLQVHVCRGLGKYVWINRDTYADIFARLKSTVATFDADPAVKALRDVHSLLKVSAPTRPLILINLPEEYGGTREYDAAQVKHLVYWLELKHFSWARGIGGGLDVQPEVLSKDPVKQREQEAFYADASRLSTLIRSVQAQLAPLYEIALKLEKVGK